jgi:hypothetical protein
MPAAAAVMLPGARASSLPPWIVRFAGSFAEGIALMRVRVSQETQTVARVCGCLPSVSDEPVEHGTPCFVCAQRLLSDFVFEISS